LATCEEKVGGASLVAGLLGKLHPHRLEPRLTASQDFQAEFIVLVHDAHLLAALFLDQVGQAATNAIKVSGCIRVFEPMKGLIHLTSGRHRKEVDDVLLKLDGHGRNVLGRPQAAHDHEHFVLVDELLRCEGGFSGVVARILHQQFDLATLHAALLMQLVDSKQHAHSNLLAISGQRTRQVLNGPQGDLGLGDPLLSRNPHR